MKDASLVRRVLARSGIRDSDGRIFTCLDSRGASVAEIARRTGLHRPTVYQSLARLIQEDLVSRQAKGKRTIFCPISRNGLRAYLAGNDRERKTFLKEISAEPLERSTRVRVLTGASGLRSVLQELLDDLSKDDLFYRYSARSAALDIEDYMPPNYRKLRDAKRIQNFAIVNDGLRKKPHKKRLEAVSKVVPLNEDMFEHGVNVLIFGDKVAFVNFIRIEAYMIHDAQVAALQRSLFKLLYSRLKE